MIGTDPQYTIKGHPGLLSSQSSSLTNMKVNKETRIFSLKNFIFSTMKLNSRSSQLFSSLLSPSRLRTARLGALHYSLTSVLVLNFRFQIFREKNLASFLKINFFFEFCQVLNQELVGQNKKFLYICSFFYTVCRSTGVDLRRSSAKW